MISSAETAATRAADEHIWVAVAVGVLGFSCATTQLAWLRELLGAFSGNEMVLGFVLGAWLLLMGVGTLIGRMTGQLRRPLVWLLLLQVFLAVAPPLQIVLIRALRNVVFTRGAEAGPVQTLGAVLTVLSPYCVAGGFALTVAAVILSRANGHQGVGQVYSADAIGSE